MKLNTIILLLAAMSFLIACGSGEAANEVTTSKTEPTNEVVANKSTPTAEPAAANTPEAIARFVLTKTQDLENLDYEALKNYTTEASNAEIDAMKAQVEQMMGQLTDDQKEQFRAEVKKMAEKQNLDAITCTEEGDKATCVYCCNPMGNDDQVFLTNVEGKWLVDMIRKE